MKHLYYIFLSLCITLALGSCKESEEEIAEASLTVNKHELSFTGYKSTIAVKVDATRRWSAIPSEFWISVTPNNYPGAGEHFIANVAITVAENGTGQPREGYVTFYLQDEKMTTVLIKQDIPNEEDKPEEEFPISWANLQWAASTSILVGDAFEAGSKIFADGLTNAVESSTGENITCDIGYSLDNTDPSGEGWTWTPCPFNADWGNEFYYQGRINNLPAGIYYYSFRCRNGSGPYKYAGTGGLWNGVGNVNGTFEVKEVPEEEDDGIDYSKLTITWVNLQWKDKDVIRKGETFSAGSKVEIKGLTDLEQAATSGNKHVICEIGYSATNSNPSGADWTWKTCPWNGDWGNEYYYQGATSEVSTTGTYYYTFRYKIDNGNYVYAGSGGIWDGTNNVNGSFQVTD